MSAIPQHMLKKRRTISEHYLAGEGIEIGALHYPLWVSDRAHVHYIDRLSKDELRQHYPELKDFNLVDIDIVDDGEKLSSVESNRFDFIIANHFLEHCENPLGAIRNHLAKVKDNGILYYAVPDKWHCFDQDRPITSFEHLVKDDVVGSEWSRFLHLREWAEFVDRETDPKQIEHRIQRLDETNYSIHFHVWDKPAFERFIYQAQSYLGECFAIEHIEPNDTEIVAVLRKRPTQYRITAAEHKALYQKYVASVDKAAHHSQAPATQAPQQQAVSYQEKQDPLPQPTTSWQRQLQAVLGRFRDR